jgi:UDP-N-acetylmuramoyl-tripeptide--D-alanyl-D-alanine ligase
MQWRNDTIVQATGGRLIGPDGGQQFDGISIDSRAIGGGYLFVAIIGERHDGHDFVEQVVGAGVRGIVIGADSRVAADAQRWIDRGVACVAVDDTTRALGRLAAFQRGRADIPVVAITGSNGKTSTRQMTALVMAQHLRTLSTRGNLNNEIGLPLTLFRLETAHEAAVLELGMNHTGEIDRLGAICRPTVGVITNVASAHLEFLGSLEGVARAKGELIRHVDDEGALILNRDDTHVYAMADQARCRVIFFGLTADADVHALNVAETASGVTFDLVLPDGGTEVQLNTPGRFMVANALAAAAVGHAVGLSAGAIKAGLETFAPEKGRLQIKHASNGVHLIDDTYNANPDSMAAAFQTLWALKGDGTAYMALGDMRELGAQAPKLHREVGRLAAQGGAAGLFISGDHCQDIAAGAREAGMDPDDIMTGTKQDIAREICRCIEPGQWLLVKGSRGMAMEDVVAAVMDCQNESDDS